MELVMDSSSVLFGVLSLVIVLYSSSILSMRSAGRKVPMVGLRSVLDHRLLANYNFFKNASSIINEGYSKFKRSPWTFPRADVDMLVLPPAYVDELRSLPSTVASPTVAHAHNLMGSHTNMNIILRNNLHFRTLVEKVTPNLNFLTPPMQDELDYAVEKDLPECENEWVSIKPYHVILRLVSRISARIFLGLPLCRSEEWLEISTEFTENVFVSLVVLRLFPMWTHGFISLFLPSSYKGASYIRRSKKLLVPEIIRRREQDPSEKRPEDGMNLLSWMMEIATPTESDPYDMAHLQVVMSLASIHTSQMNAVHVLYDLASRPGYMDELREEIIQTIQEEGPWRQWQKPAFSKLKKLDSFMKESQRFNPPSLLSYHRVMLESHQLADGMVLPRGAHISMPVNAIQNDPETTSDPDVFDGFRYYKLRQREGERHLHQFVTTQTTSLNFGHGKHACPGRFFASLEIKNILVRLIMDYDWKLEDGKGRPPNLTAHEFIFPNPDANLLMKKRAKELLLDSVVPVAPVPAVSIKPETGSLDVGDDN